MPTFYDRFRECAERWPENIALEIQNRDRIESYTYGQIREIAESIASWLIRNRYEPSARVAIFADNHPRWVAAYLGIIAGGCTAVPLDTALHAGQLATLLKGSGTSLLLCDTKHLATVNQAQPELVTVLINRDGTRATSNKPVYLDDIVAHGAHGFTPIDQPPDNVAAILYTSGTTADPKGVMLTHGNLLGEVEAVFSWADIGPNDALLGVLPLFHVLSQMANLLLPLVKGSRVVYLETLNTTELLRALAERNITAFAVVPQFFYLIHERIFKEVSQRGKFAVAFVQALMTLNRFTRRLGVNLGKVFFGRIHQLFGNNMRYLVTGGSRFDPKIAHDFHDLGIDLLQAYGLTETTGGACVNTPTNNVIGSVGPPLHGGEGRIERPRAQKSN